ncbi:MAG: helix-turn-helix domain-containing protein [Candidatus Omnitrophica bacterium]|nr:helix-turn-helix domain-containing protein [Candidatus Omnitrophota bacterium]
MNNMLTVDEVKRFLEIDQEQLEHYLKQRRLRAYKIGGTYIRFRKEDALNLRSDILSYRKKSSINLLAKVSDFWRFNNFYIISILIVIAIAYFMFRT